MARLINGWMAVGQEWPFFATLEMGAVWRILLLLPAVYCPSIRYQRTPFATFTIATKSQFDFGPSELVLYFVAYETACDS